MTHAVGDATNPDPGGRMNLRLYGYWRSSASWRVRIGLQLKGIPFEAVPVHLLREGGEHHSAAHAERNPMEQVPVLEVDDGKRIVRLTQSLAILDWLEQLQPAPALWPHDPVLRAHAWEMAEVVNAGIQPLQNLLVLQILKQELGADERAWARRFMQRGLAALEHLAQARLVQLQALQNPGSRTGAQPSLQASTGAAPAYLLGDVPSVADICLVPQLYNARRFDVAVEAFPRLLAVDSHCAQHPAFLAAHPDRQVDAGT